MAIKSATFNEAPPIKPPSTSFNAKSSLALDALQLPPYKREILSETFHRIFQKVFDV